MRRNYVKYEELSTDIKKEIMLFYDLKKNSAAALSVEDAMNVWFEEYFDAWMSNHYSTYMKNDRRVGERRSRERVAADVAIGARDRRQGARRKHFRIDIEVPLRIVETLVESSTEEAEAVDYICTLINISKGGFYFKSPKPIELSNILRVNIDLSMIDHELDCLEALAMVVRIDRLNDNEYGIGVMFSSIYNHEKEKLDTFIFKNLAYYICAK